MWSASIIVSIPRMAVTWPPTTITDCGDSSRTILHISFTFPILTMIDEIPITSYECSLSSWANASRDGKSSTVHGAEMFFWIIMMPHERWNIRSEKAPCARVTWLGYSSIGLIDRLPNSSSCA
jgi:hypothetical protein